MIGSGAISIARGWIMPRIARRSLLLGLFSASVIALTAKPARAIFCANCSTIVQQMMEYAQQVYSISVQLQQYQTQIQQYQNMVQNTVSLPIHLWSNVTNDIMQIKNLSNIGALLAGNAGSITGQLAAFDSAASQVLSLPYMVDKYNAWAQMAGQNITTMQMAMGAAQSQMGSDAAMLSTIQMQSQSATGQVQVLQAANEMASLQISQTQKLHG